MDRSMMSFFNLELNKLILIENLERKKNKMILKKVKSTGRIIYLIFSRGEFQGKLNLSVGKGVQCVESTSSRYILA